jgi:DNA polymerase III subunit beta
MKFKCTQENLNRALVLTAHLSGKNVALPILNNILLNVTGGMLHISATNLEIGIKTQIGGKGDGDGSITVGGKILADYVNLLAGETVELGVHDTTLEVRSSKHKTKIKGLPVDDFPLIPDVESVKEITLPATDFKEQVQSVVFAAAYDETRPEISGVYLVVKDGNLINAATDSYRLAERIYKLSTGNGVLEDGIILPIKTMQEVVRIIADSDSKEIKLSFNENQVMFSLGETKLISRLIEGGYPDYAQIIPKNTGTQAVVDRASLLNAVKVASLFTKNGINDVSLGFDTSGQIKVGAANSQVGEDESSVEADVNGAPAEIVFNWRYLLDGLSYINTKKVRLEVTSSAHPGLLKPAGDDQYQYLIMPIKQ